MPLPGISGQGRAVGGAGLIGYATATANLSTSLIINKPGGTIENDLIVAVLESVNGQTWTGASGWTEVLDQAVGNGIRVAYKVAGASEGANYTFTSSGSDYLVGIILTYRGFTYDTIGSAATRSGDGALSVPAITSAGGIVLVAVATSDVGGTHSTPTGTSLIATVKNTGFEPHISVFAKAVYSGSTGAISSTIGGGTSTNANGVQVGIK